MKEFKKTLKTSTISLLMLALMFVVVEPAIGNALEDQHVVTLSVTSEISLLQPAADVTMTPALAGVTGGTAYGSTTIRVLTNDSSGYSMTLTASSSAGMVGNSQGGFVPAYIPASGIVPDFTFTVPANRARFGYTVNASTTADLAQAFLDDGANCNTGAADNVSACWVNSSTTARTIINRTTSTPASGATTTIVYRATINSSPLPAIPEDIYTSTTTLTFTTN